MINTARSINYDTFLGFKPLSVDKELYPSYPLIKFPSTRGYHYITPRSILYLKAESNYTYVHFADGRSQLYSKTLKNLASYLPSGDFIRIHNSYIVNKECISTLSRSAVCLYQEVSLPVSRRMYKSIMQIINK
jgi:DNA-binding LytR/AlgR family response regulator